jgi:hypothetical protein
MSLRNRFVILLAVSLLLHVALIAFMPGDGEWVETVYARGIYPVVGPIVAFVPGLLPFSVAALLVFGLIAVAVAGFLRAIVRWRRGDLSLRGAVEGAAAVATVTLALAFHGFYLFWGYNYLRPPLEQRLGIEDAVQSFESRHEFARRMVLSAAAAYVPVGPWDRGDLDSLVDAAMADALAELEGRAPPVVSPLKGDLGTGLLARQGTRGVISPLTLEAHVDFGLPPAALAFTAAHEKAHLAGFARERDANFLAWYALTRADDPRLRYAGQFGVVHYYLDVETRLLAGPLEADLRALAAYDVREVSRPLQRVTLGVYGAYLRANRVSQGLADYWQVSLLIQAWVEQRGWPH